MQRVDEFTVPGNLVFGDVKERIKFWLKTGIGSEYQFRLITEDDVSLTRAKHNCAVCVIPCIVTALVTAMMMASFIALFSITSLQDFQNFQMTMYVYIAAIGLSFALAIGYFLLKPQVVTFELRFSHDVPIIIYVNINVRYCIYNIYHCKLLYKISNSQGSYLYK